MSTSNCVAAPNAGAGSPAGPCASSIRAAMSLGGVPATNNDVLVRYIDETVPGGAAIARYNCDKIDPACTEVCGFAGSVPDPCPSLMLESVLATPSQAILGNAIALNAQAHDMGGRALTYSWATAAGQSSLGTIAAPTAKNASLTCTVAGGSVVELTVDNGICQKSRLLNVSCFQVPTCGNGALDVGEDCDYAAPAGSPVAGPYGCPSDCSYRCGDGIVEAPAEQCEPPGASPIPNCSADCRLLPDVCGDNLIGVTELCDGTSLPPGVPPGTTCAAGCKHMNGPFPFCGDGLVLEAEECDPASTRTCSDTCQRIASDACVACEQDGACFELSDACLRFTGSDRRDC